MVKCKLCGCDKFTCVFNTVYCDRCGVAYDVECPDDVIDVDKVKIKKYGVEQINKIKNETERFYYLGVFEGYYTGLFDDRKKVREWALNRIIDLLKSINEMVGQ